MASAANKKAPAKEKKKAMKKTRKLPGFFSFSNRSFVLVLAFVVAFAGLGSYKLYSARAATSKKATAALPTIYQCYQRYQKDPQHYWLGRNYVSTGDCVKTLQWFLDGARNSKDSQAFWPDLVGDGQAPDGIFGPKTEQAVKAFQSRAISSSKGPIAADGVVGPKTWQHIAAYCTLNFERDWECRWQA